MLTIEIALKFAMDKHRGQVDKSGEPYIGHVVRVAEKVGQTEEKIVALLHDVIEDTDTTVEDLRNLGATDEMIKALDLLTHKKACKYEEYIRNIAENKLARTVKLADLEDNSDPVRLEKLTKDIQQRLIKKYNSARQILNEYSYNEDTI